MSFLKGENVSVHYPGENKPTINDVTFSLVKGEVSLFLGKSGSGKTTLLKCIGCLIDNYKGKILLSGREIKVMSHKERASNIGFVAQQYNLFANMTVLSNCTHPQICVLKRDKIKSRDKALNTLQRLHIEKLAKQNYRRALTKFMHETKNPKTERL